MPPAPRHIAIIGAGPIGLEAALYAVQRGYHVSVFERGRVAENVRQWGHVRLFSPFGMNASESGRAVLREAGHELPGDDELLTGREFVEQYCQRLPYVQELRESVLEQTSVISIGRVQRLKSDLVSNPDRGLTPFRLLLDGPDGERAVEADVVLDCSGTYGNHNWLGDGGIPCLGERAATDRISYTLPIPAQFGRYAGSGSVLVVGSGYSAATTILAVSKLYLSDPEVELSAVYWVTRTPDVAAPMSRIVDDSLSERDSIACEANSLATDVDGPVEWLPGHVVLEMKPDDRTGRLHVVLQNVDTGVRQTIVADTIIANVGYRPDRSLYEELQVHECYASQGPMKFAAKLLGETSGDCLDQVSHGPDVLRNPEPGFFILGSKSYGRNSSFLMQVGLQQIVDVFRLIDGASGDG